MKKPFRIERNNDILDLFFGNILVRSWVEGQANREERAQVLCDRLNKQAERLDQESKQEFVSDLSELGRAIKAGEEE